MTTEEIIIDHAQKPVILMIRLGTGGELINIIRLKEKLTLTEFQELRVYIIQNYGEILDVTI